jgi:hypothetical protein
MFPKNLFTNLVLIALSVGIFLTYLKPTFELIGKDQDLIAQYRDELTKVKSVNARLDQLASAANQISNEDRDRMNTYLPNQIDTVSIQRDILLIAESVGIDIGGISAPDSAGGSSAGTSAESSEAGRVERSLLVPHEVTVEFAASYSLLKSFLAALEQSNYPLHVSALNISTEATETGDRLARAAGDLSVTMTVITYTLSMLESGN